MNLKPRTLLSIFSLVCVVVATTAMMLSPQGQSPAASNQARALRSGYTITWEGVFRHPDGTVEEAYTETRYVSSNGNWHSIKKYSEKNGDRVEEAFAEVGRGVFSIRSWDGNKMQFLSEHQASQPADPENYRRSPQYVRTAEILGYKAYVLRERNGDVIVDRWFAPSLGGDVIKHIYRSKSEDGIFVRVLQPVSIVMGEPDAEKMKHPEYPVDYRIHNRVN